MASDPDDLTRLRGLLERAGAAVDPLAEEAGAEDARAWADLALEAALREDAAAAVRRAEAGLTAPGGAEPGVRLALLRSLAVAAQHAGDAEEVTRRVAQRADLLRSLGRPRQAELETQLDAALVREPDDFEATVLAGVAEAERAHRASPGADPADTVLPEALLGLAVHRIHAQDLDAALELVDECIAVLRGLRACGAVLPAGTWESARLVLARLRLWRGEHAEAEVEATTVLALPASRAVRASALLVRAIAAHERGHDDAALGYALDATERMAACGLRRGAATAAALVGRLAGQAEDQDAAVAAWALAAVHAEKAEAPEAAGLSYWWAHQLLMAGRAEEAEPLLERLARREAAAGNPVAQARALVDLGHARHDQDRSGEALPAWREAADLFEDHGEWEDAARVLLAAGALTHREADADSRPEALALFERAVACARRVDGSARDDASGPDPEDVPDPEPADAPRLDPADAPAPDAPGPRPDPAVLPSALHALGYLLCESGRPEGLALLDEAIALAGAAGSDWQAADYVDTRARALWALEHGPEAVSTALTSADLFTEAGDPDGASQAELFAAYVVAEDGRPEQAATLFRLVSESTRSELVRLGALTGLHQCLSALGDEAGAARVREDLETVRGLLGGG